MHVGEPASQSLEAERLAERGSFRRLRRHFPSRADAFVFFSGRQITRYSFGRVGDQCFGCGRGANGGVVEAVWDYRFPSIRATLAEALGAFGHVHGDRHRHGSFVTYHAVCRSCMRRWRLWRAGAAVVMAVAVIGIALGGAGTVLGLIFYLGGTFSPSDRRELRSHLPVLASAAVAGGLLWVLGSRWRTPAPLRRVARRPIDLKKMRRRSAEEWRTVFQESDDGYAFDDE